MTCHIILHLSASKSKSTVKENLDRLFSCVFKFYEANAIVLPRFHAMNFARAGNGVTNGWKVDLCTFGSLQAACLSERGLFRNDYTNVFIPL